MNENTKGWINGFIGMLIFSASLPATRAAVADFDPVFLTAARASIAAILGAMLLFLYQEKLPGKADVFSIFIVAIGVVIGFPLLTALALQQISASYSIVFIGLLPLSTAIFGVLRAGERPGLPFWVFACIGSAIVGGFALSSGVSNSFLGNTYMAGAIIICGFGYAEGARLARTLGGWQTISWALVLSLPFMVILAVFSWPDSFANIGPDAWIGLVYVSVFSMLVGFVFWYRGLAQGGIAEVGQLQLLQPFFGLMLAAVLLGETVTFAMMVVSAMVILCVLCAKYFAR
ncbi:MAG: DMT family transporter [Devosiaceae bacterium]|nr:DMT family transporter [Devosiaceae bacterium]